MQRLFVVAFPELSTADAARLDALRATHDPSGHALLKAHFTLVFGCTGVASDVVESAMRDAAQGMGAIEFCLARAELSTHGDLHYVFLYPGQGADEMLEMHKRLHAGALSGQLDPKQPFMPHMTVCKTSDRAEAQQLVEQLPGDAIRISGRLNALSLGELGDGQFRRLADVALTGSETEKPAAMLRMNLRTGR